MCNCGEEGVAGDQFVIKRCSAHFIREQEGLFGFHAEWSAVVDCVCNDGIGLCL